jgi:hypothetical protein
VRSFKETTRLAAQKVSGVKKRKIKKKKKKKEDQRSVCSCYRFHKEVLARWIWRPER